MCKLPKPIKVLLYKQYQYVEELWLRLVASANSPADVEKVVELYRKINHSRIIIMQFSGVYEGIFQNNL